jgi:CubicO group peptidase (beta-lactamase class C family)
MKKLALVLCFVLCSFRVYANHDVDRFVEDYIKKKQIPGLALLVVKDGKILEQKGYGFANLENQVPVKPETIFQSGSMGKQFTATAVMLLVEQGKINLDDPIGKYLKVPDAWNEMTVRRMLSHTSGLDDYPDDFDFRKDYTEDQLLEIVGKQPLQFAPGTQWSYSNLAFLTLGILIHKVSGQFYGDFLKEHVWQPLGMNSTRIISEEDLVPNRAAGYRLVKGQIKNQEWVAPSMNTTADGSMYFNIVDLAKWDAGLYTEKILKKSSFDQMWTPIQLKDGSTYPYGFGWFLEKTNGHRLIEHAGEWQGFSTEIARYVDDHLTVVALTNLSGADAPYVAHVVAGIYNAALQLPKHKEITIDAKTLQSYTGKYALSTDRNVEVKVEANHLVLVWGDWTGEMLADSKTTFFVPDSETTMRFVTDDKGHATSMILNTGRDRELKRVSD